MITLRKGGLNMFNWSRKFNIEISDVEIFNFLTELNGFEPTQWFITKNGGKNKKDVLAYIINNMPEHIQLIAIKSKKKNCYIDKESIVTYNKTEDIDTLTVARGEFYEIKIKLKNGTKYVLGAFPHKADALHKESMKALRTEYKQASKKAQVKNVMYYVTFFVVCALVGWSIGEITTSNGYNGVKHIIIAQQLKSLVENEENAESLDIVLEPYDKANLELEENYTTAEHGNIKMNIPSNLYIDSELGDSGESVIYTNGTTGDSIMNITIDYEPYDFNHGDEETEVMYEKLSPISEKEFGFPIISIYHYMKAMWMTDVDNINYWNYKETAMYYLLVNLKAPMVPAICQHVYDVKTDTYSGFILECGPTPTNAVLLQLSIFPDNNPELQYTVTVISGDITEAYKILNSVELLTE